MYYKKIILNKIKIKLSLTNYSVSIGSCKKSEATDIIELLDKADSQMYKNKKEYKRMNSNVQKDVSITENVYDEKLLQSIEKAIKNKEFYPYYQPQYSHSTGLLIGAEALARWTDKEYGFVSPATFIPILEENNLVSKLDLIIFEHVCKFIKECIDEKASLIPISTNISRYDILYPHFIDELEKIRTKYNIDPKYLPLEITESAAINGKQDIIAFINRLHKIGYKIEMDDFGSGYSSLNILKDINFDILKLDIGFMNGELDNGRGGTIITTVIRMASWLGMPVIAEGIETVSQADFLKSVGCDYIQGYLYSKPLPENEMKNILKSDNICAIVPQMSLIDNMDAGAFWSPQSRETLIFNNYVGAAAIFEFKNNKAEILKVNQKFLQEIGMNLTEHDLIFSDMLDLIDIADKAVFLDIIEKGKDGNEYECETLWKIESHCCGKENIYMRTNLRLIAKGNNSFLFYGIFRNITAEKQRYIALEENERKFKMASEQANIYYWEFIVATKEMKPCFRCMRDLGLPALVKNYPEPAIEQGIFPPEVADMYRDWHKQIANGVKELEAVIPLTPDRVPFLVKYTTVFDDTGRPIKAYGSATFINKK